jgi:transcriptional regulator with XRE-family HTH domain
LAGIDPDQFQACHEYLLAVRLARHMSKTDIVAASMIDGDPSSGVSLPTVSKIEGGTYGEPGFRTMIRLARGYGISISSLERFFV